MKQSIKSVGVMVINKNGKILVLLRNKKDPEGNTWGLVGGKIEKGESKRKAALREFQEETGLKIRPEDLEFKKTYRWHRKDSNLIFGLFKFENKLEFHNITLPYKEIDDFMWSKPEDLYKRKDLMLGLYEILKDNFRSI